MTVQLVDGTITLSGECGLDEAEALVRLLLDHDSAAIDWRACTAAHTAVVQVIVASKADLIGSPSSVLLADLLAPAIRSARSVVP